MKTNLLLALTIIFVASFLVKGQPVNLLLNGPQTGTINNMARNIETIDDDFVYDDYVPPALSPQPSVEIPNPKVNGPVPYNPVMLDPTTRPINTSFLVGSTKGFFNVNPMGSSTYSIPFDLPTGANGLNPGLALVYSSLGGQGIAGCGWQVTGISAITRMGQTVYQDGRAKGANLDKDDRFALDGQRLVCVSGTYGGNGSKYRTELESFSRVTAIGASGSGPEKFKVETKSGHFVEYGHTADAVQKIAGYAEAVSWYLNAVSDSMGNNINYIYMSQDGSVYPARIVYGPYIVDFAYKVRTDAQTYYFKGAKLQQKLLLDKVEVAYNNKVVKAYEFKYTYLTNNVGGQSVLNEVVEYGANGSRFNSTVFS